MGFPWRQLLALLREIYYEMLFHKGMLVDSRLLYAYTKLLTSEVMGCWELSNDHFDISYFACYPAVTL